jgi:hypothetical protein
MAENVLGRVFTSTLKPQVLVDITAGLRPSKCLKSFTERGSILQAQDLTSLRQTSAH